MLDDARNTEEQKFLKTALDTLNMTGSLYEAMKATGACPDYFIYMIQIENRPYFGRCYEFSF